jgi:hypothetical protein
MGERTSALLCGGGGTCPRRLNGDAGCKRPFPVSLLSTASNPTGTNCLVRSSALTAERCGALDMWTTLWDELREMAWLATMITTLSVVGVGLAVAFVGA